MGEIQRGLQYDGRGPKDLLPPRLHPQSPAESLNGASAPLLAAVYYRGECEGLRC